jgi:hypothetical protein
MDGLTGGRHLQLPLYALAVERVLKPGFTVERAAYRFSAAKAKETALELDRAGLAAAYRELPALLSAMTAAMRGGLFLANPSDEKKCQYCEFRLACGRGAGLEARFERKKDDPAVQAYFSFAGKPEPAS